MAVKICIDAGHYGKYNRSPANKNYYESDMAWKLHLLQKKYLEQYGFEVVLTRGNQANDLSLNSRGTKSKGCVLFISDHSNAVGTGVNESVDYVAIYCLENDSTTKCDDISRVIAEKLAPVIADVIDVKQGGRVVTRNAGYDKNGDGMLNDNYYGVLHGARSVNTPGLILEHSFHTNTRSTNWLLNDDNLDKLAKAEAKVIAEYFGMNAVTKSENKSENSIMHRVQVGAFKEESNAVNARAKARKAGFEDAFIVDDGKWYKVQIGAFTAEENAVNMLKKAQAAGFEDAFITTKGGKAVSTTPKKSVTEIAKEVIAGKWGNGTARKTALEKAGYNYSEVQKKVNELL